MAIIDQGRGTGPAAPEDDHGAPRGYSSPPCLMHDAEAHSAWRVPREALIAALNELLEAERAGAQVVPGLATVFDDPHARAVLRAVARDEAQCCALLMRQIERLGGVPSRQTGAFRDKVLALAAVADRLALLIKGQDWVAGKLRALSSGVDDPSLAADIADMLARHERNVAACRRLTAAG